jgi:hypothetical protein
MQLIFSCCHNTREVKTMTGKTKRKSKSKAQAKAEMTARAFVTSTSFKNDPSGSYTGHPKDTGDKPVQDADDL